MYYPTRDEFKKLAQKHNLIPVYREIMADFETPVSAFQKLGESDYAFLLESAESGERFGRFSFLGNNPYLTVTCKDGEVTVKNGNCVKKFRVSNPLVAIKEILEGYSFAIMPELPPFCGGAVGYLGYDSIRYFEEIPKMGRNDLDLPDLAFIFTDTVLIFDHLKHKIKVLVNAHTDGSPDMVYDEAVAKIESIIEKIRSNSVVYKKVAEDKKSKNVISNISEKDFIEAVEKAREYIIAGDVLQVVLSQRFSREISADSFDIYRSLRTINPSPYMYYLKFKDVELIGSSPEPLVKVQGKKVMTCPIAGTRPRGLTKEEDLLMEKDLLASEKERAEHIMLVDLGRNDIGRICKSGTVKVDELMQVERYSHVMHLVSTVSGEILEDKTPYDVLQAVFPAGTVSGAPKIRAMEIIDELEPTLRGPYAGAVGYFSFTGELDSCITIRTILVHKNVAYVQAGAGIVYDSIPEKEYQETVNKAKGMLKAVEMSEEGLMG